MRMQQAPAERSRDFRGTAVRLLGRLTPQRGLTAAVIVLAVFARSMLARPLPAPMSTAGRCTTSHATRWSYAASSRSLDM